MKIDKVSVIVVAFNEEICINRCIQSILQQEYNSFELIIIDDCSSDETQEIVKRIKDERIIYIRNKNRKGIAFSRNLGIKKSSADYIFFTDADCMPTKDWLKEGVEAFERKDCVGVEGRTCYETSRTSLTDMIIENIKGGAYITCNIGYRKKVLEEVGFFNEDYKLVSEDTDLAKKVLKKGSIEFSPQMLVFHQRKTQTPKGYFQYALRALYKVKYIKNTGDRRACPFRVMYPAHLIYILVPPLLILRYRIRNLKEFFLLIVLYVSYIFERVIIWIAAFKERIFLV